ncbi:MAG: hypothetical protein MUC88_14140 [Planctomycetes bacterium]|jgi:hypothetical protein|nr:hypothetical protein [Planctomycetota bacterium]
MGPGHRISEWIRVIKDTFDFGPEFPAALAGRQLPTTEELTQVQQQLEEARKACREKDELIAKLQATLPIAPVADLGAPLAESGCDAPAPSEVSEPQSETTSPRKPSLKAGRKRMAVSACPAAVQFATGPGPDDEAKPARTRRSSSTRGRSSRRNGAEPARADQDSLDR